MPASSRRHQMVVNSRYQYQVIARVVLTSILVVNAFLIVAYLLAEPGLLALATPSNAMILGFSELVIASLAFFFGLRHSLKVAGPFYVLAQSVEKMGQGDLTIHVKLRHGDSFQDVADTVNDCANSLRGKILEIKQTAAEISRQTEMQQIQQLAEQLQQQLAGLQTESPAEIPLEERR